MIKNQFKFFMIPKKNAIDIDDMEEFILAELLYKQLKVENNET